MYEQLTYHALAVRLGYSVGYTREIVRRQGWLRDMSSGVTIVSVPQDFLDQHSKAFIVPADKVGAGAADARRGAPAALQPAAGRVANATRQDGPGSLRGRRVKVEDGAVSWRSANHHHSSPISA